MPERTYKIIDLVGISEKSTDDAIRNAIARASSTLRNLSWYEVVQERGSIVDGSLGEFQVTLRLAFLLEDQAVE